MKNLFITVRDTNTGKTFVTCALAQALKSAGKKVATYKPISAGCQQTVEGLINEDAELLCRFANAKQTIKEINPIAFVDSIAPHIAAKQTNQEISLADINHYFASVVSLSADINLTEGAGGWRLPLSIEKKTFLSDFAVTTKQQVILVVNMKLGCLNHALLTYEAIKADGLSCVGWVANQASVSTMANLTQNITSLEQLLPMPKLAVLTFDDTKQTLSAKIISAAKKINIEPLIS